MVESKLNSTLKTGLVLMMSTAFSAMIQNKLQLRANINFLKTSSLDLVIMNLLKRTLSLLKKVLQKLSTINSTAADHKSSLLDQDITMLTKALTPMLRRSLLLPSAANHQFKHMHPDQAPTIIARQTLQFLVNHLQKRLLHIPQPFPIMRESQVLAIMTCLQARPSLTLLA